MINTISSNWITWLKESHKRGCSLEQVRSVMYQGPFNKYDVELVINSIWFNNPPIETLIPTFDCPYIDTAVTQINQVSIEFLNTAPVVAVLNNLLTHEQCTRLIELGSNLSRAKVVGETHGVISDHRTNDLQVIPYNCCPESVYLEQALANITRIPVIQGEKLQLLHYQPGQFYSPHQDWFKTDTLVTNLSQYGQRIATCVVYLNDTTVGGETRFPKLNISIKPKAGSAVYFEYTNINGQSTDLCLHSSEPVIEGEKWVLTKWLRQKPVMSAADQTHYD